MVELQFYAVFNSFYSYQDDGSEVLKGCVQWNSVSDGKDSRLQRVSNPEPLDQQVSASPSELPGLLNGRIHAL